MRTEEQMYDLIVRTAEEDERVRAVILNGSRANPCAPKDMFQDYDIVYIVKDIESYRNQPDWIDIYGKRIMLQKPEEMRDPLGNGTIVYLMLMEDGNRIDLSLCPIEIYKEIIEEDSQSIILLDKDHILVEYPSESDIDYHIQKPSKLYYDSCCNNFWWCIQNTAKGIWRDELPYAMDMYNKYIRDELHSMINWYIGARTDFSVSAGKAGKYFKNYLNERQYSLYKSTYSESNYSLFWESIFNMCELFRELAVCVGESFSFSYNEKDDKNMTAYLRHIRTLSHDAVEIY